MEAPSEDAALGMCEQAMDTLASEYVNSLEAFMTAGNAMDSLSALDEAEGIWQAETAIINAFDKEGEEVAFVKRMRGDFFRVLENKLEDAARDCHKDANDANVALCIGILAMMDQVLDEFGHPLNSPDRQRVRELAEQFQ